MLGTVLCDGDTKLNEKDTVFALKEQMRRAQSKVQFEKGPVSSTPFPPVRPDSTLPHLHEYSSGMPSSSLLILPLLIHYSQIQIAYFGSSTHIDCLLLLCTIPRTMLGTKEEEHNLDFLSLTQHFGFNLRALPTLFL